MPASVQLHLITEEAQKQINQATYAGCAEALDDVAERAADLSPKKTGRNAASIKARLRGLKNDKMKGIVYSESGYGGFLEVGTKNMPAQPYLYPAAIQVLPGVADLIRVKLQK